MVVVIGAANIDIMGTPHNSLILNDSSPGVIEQHPGGVGRNIAEGLTKLGETVQLITAYGDDLYGHQLEEDFLVSGIHTDCACQSVDRHTSLYLTVNNHRGEMEASVCDTGIMDEISPSYIRHHWETIRHASLCIADANVREDTLTVLGEMLPCPLMVDPVSTQKAKKLKKILHKIHSIKPNRYEAEILTGITITSDQTAKEAIQQLLQIGVEQIFLTMGDQGVISANSNELLFFKNPPIANIINTNGAGDSFFAAVAYGTLHNYTLSEITTMGQQAARQSLLSPSPVGELQKVLKK